MHTDCLHIFYSSGIKAEGGSSHSHNPRLHIRFRSNDKDEMSEKKTEREREGRGGKREGGENRERPKESESFPRSMRVQTSEARQKKRDQWSSTNVSCKSSMVRTRVAKRKKGKEHTRTHTLPRIDRRIDPQAVLHKIDT